MSDAGPTEQLSYEQARAQLRDVVARLESGGQSLEESLALWERGEALADTCQAWLSGATARLDRAIAEHDADTADTNAASDTNAAGDNADSGDA